jgi:chromate reductase
MASILAFAGSNSSKSINYELVKFTINKIQKHKTDSLNLANYPFPMFSVDLEEKEGYSNSLVELKNEIQDADALLIAVNEHNGHLSAYFKNMLDWLSRLDRKFMLNKKVFLMGASTGKGGAKGAISMAETLLPRFGATITATFSMPSFGANFNTQEGIVNKDLLEAHEAALEAFLKSV